jgi:hypothetical protein
MKLPGFTAAAAADKANGYYQLTADQAFVVNGGAISPQGPIVAPTPVHCTRHTKGTFSVPRAFAGLALILPGRSSSRSVLTANIADPGAATWIANRLDFE